MCESFLSAATDRRGVARCEKVRCLFSGRIPLFAPVDPSHQRVSVLSVGLEWWGTWRTLQVIHSHPEGWKSWGARATAASAISGCPSSSCLTKICGNFFCERLRSCLCSQLYELLSLRFSQRSWQPLFLRNKFRKTPEICGPLLFLDFNRSRMPGLYLILKKRMQILEMQLLLWLGKSLVGWAI